VNTSAGDVAEVPSGVVTVTSGVPEPDGEVTVMEPDVSAVTVPGLLAPKSTAVAFSRFDPEMVTPVPPPAGPVVGLMPVTIGAAT
jgi:hypothetical protein